LNAPPEPLFFLEVFVSQCDPMVNENWLGYWMNNAN